MNPLYKRLLLTLFPEEMKQADVNPANMFLSSLSTKEFFSILCRRIIEYYKFNGFDAGLETFEAKIGIGVEQGVAINKAQDYYGYLIAAQYTGQVFYSPGSVSLHFTLMSGSLILPHINSDNTGLFIAILQTLYLTPFVFVSQIKCLPPSLSKKDRYLWFTSLWSELFVWVQEHYNLGTYDAHDGLILMHHDPHIVGNLLHICTHASTLFSSTDSHTHYRGRLLDTHIYPHNEEPLSHFLNDYNTQSLQAALTSHECYVLDLLLPRDFLLQNLYQHTDIIDVMTHIISPRYTENVNLNTLRGQLSDDSSVWSDFLTSLISIDTHRTHFWSGVQKFITNYRSQHTDIMNEGMDDFMSAIHEGGPVDISKVPDSIKAESRSIEQMVNVYIGIVGGHRSAKGDNYRHRRIGSSLTQPYPDHRDALHHTIDRYRLHELHLYHTNGFYYQRAWEQIQHGKQKFHIPLLTPSTPTSLDNEYRIHTRIDHAAMHLGQSMLPVPMALSVHQTSITNHYKTILYDRIAPLLCDHDKLSHHHYALINQLTGSSRAQRYTTHITTHTEKTTQPLKQTLYRLDHRIWHDMLTLMNSEILDDIHSIYDDRIILHLISKIEKTLFGIMLWVQSAPSIDHESLRYHYYHHVLHIEDILIPAYMDITTQLMKTYEPLLSSWISLDDNPLFLDACHTMRKDSSHSGPLIHEDTLWLHSVLHHITSYNKRYIIPDHL